MLAAITYFPLIKVLNIIKPNNSRYIIDASISRVNHRKASSLTKEMGTSKEKSYWLLKTEPGEWSWDDQAANNGLSKWDGVKNKQAQKYMKSMSLEDLCFFYHSGTKSRHVVGVVEVVREWYEDGDGGAVDVKAVGEMNTVVGLAEMKRELKGMEVEFALFRQSRLSVVPVERRIWDKICEMGGGYGNSSDNE